MNRNNNLIKNKELKTSERRRRAIIFSLAFSEEIDSIKKLLKDSREDRKKYLKELPYPYIEGFEIEFRYYGFEQLQRLLKEIINDFVPMELKELYLKKILLSPIDKLVKHLFIESDILLDEKEFRSNNKSVHNF
ncbi:hypothetical protein LCGC14_1068380 [marine sediment metagenome]|uniref:Uncharacterized protein n=1 Tax=marine sediment metagenome TaxID=412755 RepID=A0A0F9Q271_9ZZZZ